MKKISDYGLDITNIDVTKLPTTLDRVGLLVINTYEGTYNSLGDGPMNDGVNMSLMLNQRYGYQVYYLVNTRKTPFIQKLRHFLRYVTNELVIYYTGHGTYVPDKNGDEDDGYDEAMVFIDGNIIDDDLFKTILDYKVETSKCVLISDCCHSGTIWDIQSGLHYCNKLPNNVMSISAATDKQTAKQCYIEKLEQGIFTYNMNNIVKLDPNITPLQLKERLKNILKRYGQTVVIATTSEDMLNNSLF